MTTERNVRGGKEPVYQNYPFRKPPLPPPDATLPSVTVVPVALEQTIPIWNVKGDENGNVLNSLIVLQIVSE